MNVTVKTSNGKVIARAGNRQHTQPVNSTVHEAGNHGTAARALVSRIAPGYRRAEILNSVKVKEARPGKTVYTYKD